MSMLSLKDADLKGKRVFYRPDYNVPLKDGKIQDDLRIKATLPTLEFLMEQGAKIIIGCHLGRPDGERKPEFELRPVAEYLANQFPKLKMHLAHEVDAPEVTETIEAMGPGDMLLLPNLRFFAQEEANDEAFAKILAGLADVYVNDAFACDHRAHASIAGVPALLPHYPGYLLEHELATLGSLLKEPAHPFVVIMGGAKVSDKIEVIQTLAKQADHILIGGAMANTFLLAKGEHIGQSLAEAEKVDVAKKLIEELGEKLILAKDFVKDSEDAENFKYMDIGEESVAEFETYLKEAKTIFWNGSLGYTEDAKFAKASAAIATYIGDLKGVTSIVAGGDTDQMIDEVHLRDKFSFISTGGGAALEFLAGKSLPGVAALEK